MTAQPAQTAAATGAGGTPATTGSRGSRVLGLVTLAGVVALALFALVFSPADAVQGDSVRLMYVHVPTAILAFAAFGVTALGSALYLWRRSQFWDLVAASSAEVGVVFCGLTLVVGMLWGRPTWGVYWVWDARLTTTAVLFVLYLGYLAVRRLPTDADVRAKWAAIAGLIAFIDVPIVHFSVDWWRTLHQGPTISRLDPQIDGLMLFTLVLGLVVFALVYLWLMVHRFRVAFLEDTLDRRALEGALAARRAEADVATEPAGGEGAPEVLAPAGGRS